MPYYSPPTNIPKVEEALNHQTVDTLKALAGLVSENRLPTRKADLISLVIPHLKGAALKQLWERCDRLQKAAIAEVVHSPTNTYQRDRFVSKYGEGPNWGEGNRFSTYSYKPSILGLFFYHSTMPDDLKVALKVFVPPPESTQVKSYDTIPDHLSRQIQTFDFENRKQISQVVECPLRQYATESQAFRELKTILRLVDLGKVAVSDKTFHPTTATLDGIAAVLEQGDYYHEPLDPQTLNQWESAYPIGHIKPFAWVMLLQAGKLVELSGKKLVLTKSGQKALADPAQKTLQALWKSWQKTTFLDELRRVDSIKGQTGKAQRHFTALAKRREPIVDALQECPAGPWIQVQDFLRYMIAAGHDLSVSRNPENLKIEGLDSFDSYYNFDRETSFQILEGRYLLCFLFEYVATLGLIDVAFVHPDDHEFKIFKDNYDSYQTTLSRYDGLTYFRITPFGAYCLGLSDHYTPAELPQTQILRVLPNLEVVVIAPLSRADRLMLESFLVSVSDSVWKLDQAKLLDAIAQGRSVDELKTFLANNSSEAFPQTVTHFLQDLQTRTTSLQDLGSARLIRCSDPALATLIANDSHTKAYCFLADQPKAMTTGQACYLAIPLVTETKFRNALKKLGYSLPG